MTRERLNVLLAAILTTLHEQPKGCPESTIYQAMGMNLQDYMDVRSVLVVAELVQIEHNWVKLTDKGRELAVKIEKAVA